MCLELKLESTHILLIIDSNVCIVLCIGVAVVYGYGMCCAVVLWQMAVTAIHTDSLSSTLPVLSPHPNPRTTLYYNREVCIQVMHTSHT